MFHKAFNVASMGILIVLTVVLSLLEIKNNFILLVAVLVYGAIYIIINAKKKDKFYKVLLYPLFGMLVAFGLVNFTMMGFAVYANTCANIEASDYSKGVMSSYSTYKQLFEDDNYYYYMDRSFTNFAVINKKDYVDVDIYNVESSENVSNDLSIFSPFYDLKNASHVTKTCDYEIAFAFVRNAKEKAILMRIKDGDKVYYTYIIPKDLREFASSISVLYLLGSEGYSDFYSSASSISVDMNNPESATQDAIALMVVTDDFYTFTDATFIAYDNPPDYVTRVNDYLNQDILQEIKSSEKELAELEEGSEEYNALEQEITQLNTQIYNFYVELVNEKITDNAQFRYYRTYYPTNSDDMDDLDTITVFEYEYEDGYMMGSTSLPTQYLFNYEY